jgi:hypothetical protein
MNEDLLVSVGSSCATLHNYGHVDIHVTINDQRRISSCVLN